MQILRYPPHVRLNQNGENVLILDEVLAVGDAAFRSKCFNRIGKLRDRTAIFFVSHNAAQVSLVCDSVLYLKNGKDPRWLWQDETQEWWFMQSESDVYVIEANAPPNVLFRNLHDRDGHQLSRVDIATHANLAKSFGACCVHLYRLCILQQTAVPLYILTGSFCFLASPKHYVM